MLQVGSLHDPSGQGARATSLCTHSVGFIWAVDWGSVSTCLIMCIIPNYNL